MCAPAVAGEVCGEDSGRAALPHRALEGAAGERDQDSGAAAQPHGPLQALQTPPPGHAPGLSLGARQVLHDLRAVSC